MSFDGVRYSALAQEDDDEDRGKTAEEEDVFHVDMEEKYRSAFTFANYNDLDNMGYEEPKR